ncbi:glyoxalase superfamily protein [Woodsholea maritima]|uniref:glyoxalase superfamily protein n=1 Tax=Woodsholea maritima TaxID=240237 RepID=UPI000377251B|nr:glyoxalase superfamily protein [Woodsholea maritima]
MNTSLSPLDAAKQAARDLRQALSDAGTTISHSQALEVLAKNHGFADWNTYCAALKAQERAWAKGDRVKGQYLGQDFIATIHTAIEVEPGWYQIALDLDQAVDVVTFESFSAFRKRVQGLIGPKGHSKSHTSNGKPVLTLVRL